MAPLFGGPKRGSGAWYERRWRKWVAKQLGRGTPRSVICEQLMRVDAHGRRQSEERLALSVIAHEIEGVMVDRNLQGRVLEHQRRTEEAVALYEANVADAFVGSHPYERLRVIYTKRKDYANALRVCEAYLAAAANHVPSAEKRRRFAQHRDRLTERLRLG